MQDSDLEDCDCFDLDEEQPEIKFPSPSPTPSPTPSPSICSVNSSTTPCTLTADQVWSQFILAKSQALCSALSFLSPDECVTILQLCNWNNDDAISRVLSEGAFFASFTRAVEGTSSRCFVCGNDAASSEHTPLYTYSCSHCICLDCLCGWSKARVEELHSSSSAVVCPAVGCKRTLVLPLEVFEAVALVKAATVRSLVECGSFLLRGCNKCSGFIWAPELRVSYEVVQCTLCCDHNEPQCFGCGYANGHLPLPCAQFEEWERESPEEAQSAQWIYENAKACPQCQVVIQRTEGCNHMTCKMCKYQFCWVCLQIWKSHENFSCHIYKGTGKQAHNTGEQHEFFLFHWNRFVNHAKAIEVQNTKLRSRLTRLRDNSSEKQDSKKSVPAIASSLSWIGMEFLFQSLDELLEARRVLQYNYAFMFFLQQNAESQVYGDCVQDLADAVERLSALFEEPEMATVQQVQKVMPQLKHWTAYLKVRRKVLLEETIRELQSGKWYFTSFAERKKLDGPQKSGKDLPNRKK